MVHMNESESLAIANLLEKYRSGSLRPTDIIDAIYQRIASSDDHVWISLVPPMSARARANELQIALTSPSTAFPSRLKTTSTSRGMSTTAGCPGFAYTPPRRRRWSRGCWMPEPC